MNDQNTQILLTAFPNVFDDSFFFECGDGWFELVGHAAAFIDKIGKGTKIVEVKEKFGSLRIYYEYSLNEDSEPLLTNKQLEQIYNFISNLETRSKSICEDCGQELTHNNRADQKKMGYWIRNICITCHERHKERKLSI